MPNPEMFGPASMALGQTISSFSTFLPKLSEVRKASKTDTDMAGDVRMGEVGAVVVSLGVGAIASSLTGSPVPVVAALLMAVVLIALYESALRGEHLFEPTKEVIING